MSIWQNSSHGGSDEGKIEAPKKGALPSVEGVWVTQLCGSHKEYCRLKTVFWKTIILKKNLLQTSTFSN